MSSYPPKLDKIINLFETLPEVERRETLVSYADSAKKQEPREGEQFDLEDVRKDEECADTVGVYLHVDNEGKAHFRMTLGPEVQTLTRAMTAILCKGLDGATPQEVLDLPSDFVTRIVGAELVRVRSQTTYYILTRMKGICKVYLDRQRRHRDLRSLAAWRSITCSSAAGRTISGSRTIRPSSIITLDVGPRVISYRTTDGENVFKTFDTQLGGTGEAEWQSRGGHRFWLAPEDPVLSYLPDNEPVEHESSRA